LGGKISLGGARVGEGQVRVPEPLRTGDLIGLICPAGAPWDASRVEAGRIALESRGYRVRVGRHALSRHGAFAGTDAERLADVNEFLRDPEVRMLMAVRGGYGCMRLLEGVDYEAARRDPKWLVGYSDVTALQMALWQHAGWVTISGPMAGVEFRVGPDPFTESSFWPLVVGSMAGMDLGNPPEMPWQVLSPGVAEGRLMGGCLSLVTALVGTRHFPDVSGAILVLEDIHEHVHRIDRMLVQLRMAGVFDRVSAVVLGQFTDCGPAEPRQPWLTLETVVREVLEGVRVPVVMGYAYGHEARKRSLPFGMSARLVAGERSEFRIC